MEYPDILVVCTGNICRSPMAMVYLQKRISDCGMEYRIGSAGVHALPDYPASKEAQEVVKTDGLDLSEHRSQPISPALIHHARYIITMEHWQREWIKIYTENEIRIDVLSEFLPGGDPDMKGIFDPIGLDRKYYEQVYHMIKVALDRWIEEVLASNDVKRHIAFYKGGSG